MAALTNSFLAGAPDQLHEIFFNPMNERLRLTTQMYGEHNDVRQIRTVRNAHLIDCTPQPLKSLANYRGAAAIYLATPVREYLKKHTVLIPGDWPSQFYQRQLAYNEQPDSPLRNTTPTIERFRDSHFTDRITYRQSVKLILYVYVWRTPW